MELREVQLDNLSWENLGFLFSLQATCHHLFHVSFHCVNSCHAVYAFIIVSYCMCTWNTTYTKHNILYIYIYIYHIIHINILALSMTDTSKLSTCTYTVVLWYMPPTSRLRLPGLQDLGIFSNGRHATGTSEYFFKADRFYLLLLLLIREWSRSYSIYIYIHIHIFNHIYTSVQHTKVLQLQHTYLWDINYMNNHVYSCFARSQKYFSFPEISQKFSTYSWLFIYIYNSCIVITTWSPQHWSIRGVCLWRSITRTWSWWMPGVDGRKPSAPRRKKPKYMFVMSDIYMSEQLESISICIRWKLLNC